MFKYAFILQTYGFNAHLGNRTKSMVGDEFTKECRSLEKYIQLLLVHPSFCNNENLTKFLIEEEVWCQSSIFLFCI